MARITIEEWLAHHKFRRFPFDQVEAESEGFLLACFIAPSNFRQLLGRADVPTTTFIFGEKGSGKTAIRLMLNYYCNQGLVPGISHTDHVLSVPHTQLGDVLKVAREDTTYTEIVAVSAEHHACEILKRAMPALSDLLARVPELSNKVRSLPDDEKQELSWFLDRYGLLLNRSQDTFLQGVGLDLYGTKPDFFRRRERLSSLEHLEFWSQIIRQIGIPSMYVLVDRVDELPETVGNLESAFELIRPLLTDLHFIRMPNLALKCFFPSNLQTLIEENPIVREEKKRQRFVSANIVWEEEELIDILRSHLAALRLNPDAERVNTPIGFDDLCEPELQGQIESTLAMWSRGNPRHLLLLCGLLVIAHCNRDIAPHEDLYLLGHEDLDIAIKRFQFEVSPPLDVILPSELRSGVVILNRYRVQKVTQTQNHVVAQAWDQLLSRFVVIKFVRFADNISHNEVKRLQRQLEREGRILASLHHPHIGQVHDIIQEPFGMIMEWVEGKSLRELLECDNPLLPSQVITIGKDIADALVYAHKQGVVHRDIKPDNIILTDDVEKAILIDFGIARSARQDTISSSDSNTRSLGTPMYTAPEQLNKKIAGPPTDLFSLGMVLYELLTLEQPYSYGNDPALYEADHLPQPLQREIPQALYNVVCALLNEDASQRPTAIQLYKILSEISV